MIVELHILQNFAPSCLNRDDTNSPKECEFGGYRRARISSQCIKRSIRWNGIFRELLKNHLSSRSLKFPNQVYEDLIKLNVAEPIAREIGKGLVAIAKKEAAKGEVEMETGDNKTVKDKKVKDTYELDIFKTPQMVFYTNDEVSYCANKIKILLDKGLKPMEVLKKDKKGKFENLDSFPIPHSVDIGLFGRMVTSAHFSNIDAACQVAHAISTHKVGREFDFYTAVDDLPKEDETGAGMMGDIEFNSACYYRYANIDMGQLKHNLDDDELAHKAVEAFIRAAISAIPSGKQTSFSAQNPPDFIFAVVRDSGAWSLANAFSNPVKTNGDLVADSIDALSTYWNKIYTIYGSDGIKAKPVVALRGSKFDGLDRVNNIDELVAKVNIAIAAKK